jgi:hypothetical protein
MGYSMLRVRPVQVCPAPVRAASSGQVASARIESRRLRRVNGYARAVSNSERRGSVQDGHIPLRPSGTL